MKDYSNHYNVVQNNNDIMLRDGKTIFEMQLKGIDGVDILLDGVPNRALVINSINPENELKEERTIQCKIDSGLKRGNVVTFDKQYFLVTSDIDNYKVYLKGKMQKCNDAIRYKDKNGNIDGCPVIAQNQTMYNTGLAMRDEMEYGNTIMNVIVPIDYGRKYIHRGSRFIFDINREKIAYRATYLDNSRKGLLVFQCTEDMLKPEDDLENNVAYNPVLKGYDVSQAVEIKGAGWFDYTEGIEMPYFIDPVTLVDIDFNFSVDNEEIATVTKTGNKTCILRPLKEMEYVELRAISTCNTISVNKNIFIRKRE